MNLTALVQLTSACVGVVGSIFFAIGVMRQSVEAMASLSGTYWDWNPHMPAALARQKADYLFGGGLILVAFFLQLVSFVVPSETVLSSQQASAAPWVAAVITVCAYLLLSWISGKVAARFEAEVTAWLKVKVGNQDTTA